MEQNKNIITNKSLADYKAKYKNLSHNLIKYSKKEVEDFDKQYKTKNNYLLGNKKWALIDDTYYEIPKAPRWTWFRNLHAACQIGSCVLLGGIVATAVIVPVVIVNNLNTKDSAQDVETSDKKNTEVKFEKRNENGDCIYSISVKEDKRELIEIVGVKKVTIGDNELKIDEEYEIVKDTNSDVKLTVCIKAKALEKYKGKIVITPDLKEKGLSECIAYEKITIGETEGVEASFDETLETGENPFKISIPKKVTIDGTEYPVLKIAEQGFNASAHKACKNLVKVTLPSSLKVIDYLSFAGTKIYEINIPASVESIDPYSFIYCNELSSIVVDTANPYFDSRNNCNAIIQKNDANVDGAELVLGCGSTVIPNDIVSIGNGAFYDCATLKSINIPASVQYIGNYAFALDVEASVLTSVTIEENSSLNEIGSCAFYKQAGLTEFTIPSNTTVINGSAFEHCDGLANVYFQDTTKKWKAKKILDPSEQLDVSDSAVNAANLKSRDKYALSKWTKIIEIL